MCCRENYDDDDDVPFEAYTSADDFRNFRLQSKGSANMRRTRGVSDQPS